MLMNYALATALLISIIAWVVSGIAVADRPKMAAETQTSVLIQTSQLLARR